ncbi:MAG: putative DMT superfamily transporter inner membrane protein [Candidatus Methanofastidiosum methylothiophilum]|uniref:Putative DMT superfamily transporter inner membrane protein n=1 Tax=Candidatus Methanofastidiosum methylothiophilum TaxID=1705564 RepID=A0A150IIW9_9EURY|nr:MAG: putative DMT superfamily transporter inner membrane protein [Candidatus Methanofastidiosum methylthiophilus]KYC48703.1 MAG: putative DMT superfamily transporter inner membrane protein [Candidatus Methanofastidiosum methylthiophilus]KYC51351.1 MAG: putative DMT superfamily transporter inner membrane protein [Candidatus Methanofastidiosum methylthiophilus]
MQIDSSKIKQIDKKTALALLITLIFWASAFAGIRAGLKSYEPGHLALLRFLVASAFLIIYGAYRKVRLPEKKDLPMILLIGFLSVTVYHSLLSYGEVTVTAGAASLIIGSGPIFTALLASFILKEKLKSWGWIGIFISFFGVALISLGEGGGISFDPRAILILIAAFSTSLSFVLQKPYLKKYKYVDLTAYTIWGGTLFLLIFTPGFINDIRTASIDSTLSIIYLGIFPAGIAYLTWTYALAKMPVSILTSFLAVSPFLSIIIAWAWLGEIPGSISIIGGVIAILGVMLVNMKGR